MTVNNPEDITKMEDVFSEELKTRGEEMKYFKDPFGEHPEENTPKMEEMTEKIKDITTPAAIFGELKKKVNLLIKGIPL